MNYTWGYVKEASLIKMDLTVDNAISQGLINKFSFFANEAITMICSAIKPKYSFAQFKVRYKDDILAELVQTYDVTTIVNDEEVFAIRGADGQIDLSFLEVQSYNEEDLNDIQTAFLSDYRQYTFVNEPAKMPSDFISFGSDRCTVVRATGKTEEVHSDDCDYYGYNQLAFLSEGEFNMSYNARWYTFLPTTTDSTELDIPADIVDCLPSYIASQCLKIDDEQKATIYRNEWELMLSRIDDTRFFKNKTFKIAGGW